MKLTNREAPNSALAKNYSSLRAVLGESKVQGLVCKDFISSSCYLAQRPFLDEWGCSSTKLTLSLADRGRGVVN